MIHPADPTHPRKDEGGRGRYWYFINIDYCPLCDKTDTYRTRRYDPRPADSADRYKFTAKWNHCNVF